MSRGAKKIADVVGKTVQRVVTNQTGQPWRQRLRTRLRNDSPPAANAQPHKEGAGSTGLVIGRRPRDGRWHTPRQAKGAISEDAQEGRRRRGIGPGGAKPGATSTTDILSVRTWLTDRSRARSHVSVRNLNSGDTASVQTRRKARLDATRNADDQPGPPGQDAPAGVRFHGGFPGGCICCGGLDGPPSVNRR